MSAIQCPICFENFTGAEPTAECPADRRPTVMPGPCGRSICMSCAESHRVTQREELKGDDSMIRCMFCKVEFHSVNHVFYPNRNLMEVVENYSITAKSRKRSKNGDDAPLPGCDSDCDGHDEAGHAAPSSPSAVPPSSQRSGRQVHKRIKYCGVWGDYYGEVDGNGKFHGSGTFKWDDGDKYVGEWRDGEQNGQGTVSYANGDAYEGGFKEGDRDGHGRITYTNDDVYVGEFKDDKMEGQGKYTYDNGDVYEGEFVDGNFEGKGRHTNSSGAIYVGTWKNNKQEGHGSYTYDNGDVYDGEFKESKMEGQGRMTYADGDAYDGEWKDDMMDGRGTYVFADGRREVSCYSEDNAVGEGAVWSADKKTVWRLEDGERKGEISLSAATAIADRLDLPVPQ